MPVSECTSCLPSCQATLRRKISGNQEITKKSQNLLGFYGEYPANHPVAKFVNFGKILQKSGCKIFWLISPIYLQLSAQDYMQNYCCVLCSKKLLRCFISLFYMFFTTILISHFIFLLPPRYTHFKVLGDYKFHFTL